MFGWFKRKAASVEASATDNLVRRRFHTLIAGIYSAPDGEKLVRQLRVGDPVQLSREPDNPHDKNAVAVLNSQGHRIGYIPAKVAEDLARSLDDDIGTVKATVAEKLGTGREHKKFNAQLLIELVRQRRRPIRKGGTAA